MGSLFVLPRFTPINGSGRPYSGCKLYIYRAGTSTLASVYEDSGLTSYLTNPVVADANGQLPAIYLEPNTGYNYRVVLKTSADVELWAEDDVPAGSITSDDVGRSLYPRTTEEIAASVTPTAYQYAPGDFRRYGAVGDGSTDDASAVRQALSQHNSGGPAPFGQHGDTYLCTSWTVYSPSAFCTIRGNGCTIKGPSSATVFLSPAAGFDIQNVTFDRWDSVIKRVLADSGSAQEFRFTDNVVVNGTGLQLCWQRPIANFWIERNRFQSCSGGYAILVGENTYANQDTYLRGFIRGNYFKSLTATSTTSCAAMLLYGREYHISGNTIDGVQGDSGEGWGIYTKCRYSVIEGNIIRNVSSTSSSDVVGINVKGTPRSLTSSPQGFNSICANNNIYNVGVSNSKGYGIRAQTDDITIQGNHVEDAGLSGIVTDDSNGYSNTLISDNFVVFTTSTGTSGVRVEGNGSHVQVVDNIIRNAVQGVKVDPNAGALDSVRIAGNLIDADTSVIEITEDENLTNFIIESNVATSAATNGLVINAGAGTPQYWTVRNNDFRRCGTAFNGTMPANSVVQGNRGYVTSNGGTSSAIASGATISHGLSVTPTMVNVTPTVTGLSNIYVSAIGASTFTVNYTGGGSNAFLWEARGGGEYGF